MQETRARDLRVRSFFLPRSRAPCLPRWPITTCISGVMSDHHIEHISSAELVILDYHLHFYRQFFCDAGGRDYDAGVPVWWLVPIISHYVHYYHTVQSLQFFPLRLIRQV